MAKEGSFDAVKKMLDKATVASNEALREIADKVNVASVDIVSRMAVEHSMNDFMVEALNTGITQMLRSYDHKNTKRDYLEALQGVAEQTFRQTAEHFVDDTQDLEYLVEQYGRELRDTLRE